MAFQLQSCLHGHGVGLKLQTKLPTSFRCCLNVDYTKKPSDMDLQLQSPLHNGLPNRFPKGTWKIPPTNVHPPTASNVINLTSVMSSIFIKGHLPPPQQSIYLEAARAELKEYTERYKIKSFDIYVAMNLPCVTYMYAGAIDSHRVALCTRAFAIAFFLDDMLYDFPQLFPCEDYGVDRSIFESPHKTRELLKRWNIALRQEEIPSNPTPIERMMWEMGHDLRALSTPDWFNKYADAFIAYDRSVVDSTGHWPDLDTFIQFRFTNVGAWFGLLLLEVTSNKFLPAQVRNHPTIEQGVTFSSGAHAGFVNDIMSYTKEVEESNPRNVVIMLMNSENLLLPQAMWRTVDVVNSYSHAVLKAAADASLTWKSEVVCKYVEDAMQLMTGVMYWHLSDVRYQHPNSIFPELRSESESGLDDQQFQEIFLG